ncbi:hypothetical protein FG379_002653 [Cryptosporidium bovis]|uniref:uncharacterized protein n=1 Tax=Cryptosporidium bovis TaxID=310047 RepID=UPI00351AA808|nr:hypothetical protein FG379_002653 [Cryptosporidium bovis]
MDDIHSLLSRQNENLRRLEVALSDAMSRIETIEKLYVGDKEKNFRSEEQLDIFADHNQCRLCEQIYGVKNDCDSTKTKEITNQPLANEFNEIIVNKNSRDLITTKGIPLNEKNSDIRTEINNKSKSTIECGIGEMAISSGGFTSAKRLVNISEFESLNLNSISTTPNTPVSTEITYFQGNFESFGKHTQKFDIDRLTSASEQGRKDVILYNVLQDDSKREVYSNGAIRIAKFGMENPTNCINENINHLFKKSVVKSNEINNQYFIFDEEENSNTRQDPLYLENAENEFYYLKGQVKRASLTCKWRNSSNVLQNINNYKEFKSVNFTHNKVPNEFKSSVPVIREIRYHIPREQIIGYVHVPYNILLDKPNGINQEINRDIYTELRARNDFSTKDKNLREHREENKYENLSNKPHPFRHLDLFLKYHGHPSGNVLTTFPIRRNFKYCWNQPLAIIRK